MDKIRILLVDDEEAFRKASAEALERRGFEVMHAASGEEALAALAHERPDVVVLDLRMQGMDGIATLREIRELDEDLPVVILTGHGKLDDVLSGIRLGIVDFLQKPVDIDRLGAHVRRLLVRGRNQVLRERHIGELMVPASSYLRVYDDEPVRQVVAALRDSFGRTVFGRETEMGHRTVLVFDREETFVGLLRIGDVVDQIVPRYLRDSPYSSYFTGMFLGQCKLFGKQRVGEILGEPCVVDLGTPVMEAVYLMSTKRLINLPVVDDGRLVGILRDKDILLEIAAATLGEV